MKCFCGVELEEGTEVCDKCRERERKLASEFESRFCGRKTVTRDELRRFADEENEGDG